MKKYSISRDKKGVIEMPIQHIIAITIASIAVAAISFAGYQLWRDMQVKEAIKEVDKIVEEAELMYNSADNGATQTIAVDFPPGIEKVVFGSANPSNSNHYYILMDWGENRSFYAKYVHFTGNNGGKAVIYSSVRSVTLELFCHGEDKYVKISIP